MPPTRAATPSDSPPTTKTATGDSVSPKPSCRKSPTASIWSGSPGKPTPKISNTNFAAACIPKKAGVVRLLAFTNYANMGIYRDQVIKAAASRHHARHHRTIPGTSRASTASASTSSRISRTTSPPSPASDGTTARPNPSPTPKSIKHSPKASARTARGGIASRIAPASPSSRNAIKKDHQNYLAAGGLGFLLGDGHLNYGRENIFESYYTVHVWRGIYLAPGVQHINNPGYNRDRGPVVVPTFRAHVEF